jgi:hypothetical protein
MGKKAVADVGTERLGRDKHTALHHQFGQTDAAQKTGASEVSFVTLSSGFSNRMLWKVMGRRES